MPAQTLAQTPQINTPPLGAGKASPARPPAPTAAPAQAVTKPPPASPAAAPIRLRAGDHPTFTRLVFDWPERVEFSVSAEGGKATVRFANPTPVDLGRLPDFPPRGISGLSARIEGGASIVTFGMPDEATIKSWRDGTKIVLDVAQPRETKAAKADSPEAKPTEPKPAAGPKMAEPKMAEPKMAEARPKADDKAAAQPKPQTPPKAEEAAKAPPAPKPAENQAKPAPAASSTASGSAKAAAPQNGVPAAAPIEPVQTAALGTFMPAPPTGPIAGEPLVPGVDSTRTGPLLHFPWTRPVGAAAFQRNGYLWLVFDRPAVIDLRPITTRDWNGAINGVEQLPMPGLTVLRLAVPSGTTANFTRRNAGWQVAINTVAPSDLVPKEGAPAGTDPAPVSHSQAIDVRRQLDADGGAKLFFAANDPSPQVQVQDPDTGDVITVLPYAGANGGVPGQRDFIELSVLPSFQGFAIEPHADNLDIRRFPRGVEIGTPNGLSLSAPRGADPRSGVTEILRFAEWRNVEGKDFREQKENLLHRVAVAPPGQRQAARIALAEFFAAHHMEPETLGVLARARAEQPDLERDKLYRALRGIANLGLGRLDDAANDLDSKIFDDDPDVLAYRGALAGERYDWPAARRAFSLAGAAVARFPADLRAPLRLTMARAWLAGGDVAAATAEMQALQGDSLTPGLAAEANYVRGMLAEATNKPEEAIRYFDLASASGDRRARALAEFAKTELMLSRKLIDTAQAIERLDKLRFAWRGGPYEFNLLRRLGELQFAVGDLRSGITTFRQVVKYFPKSPDIPLLNKQMSDEFTKLFLDGGAQSLPPLAALALFYDYRELTPPGPEGDEIIGKLADRLVSVDLLNRAAELLEHQIKYRLRGEDRAKAGARLAVVHLLDHNPDGALKALQDTQAANLSPAVAEERRLLQVRALGDLDRFAEALNLLGQDEGTEARNLRADLYWRAKDWPAFARVATQILGNGAADAGPLSADQRKLALQLAVAYSLSNDTAALDELYHKYEAKFRDTPDAAAFTAVASTINRANGDPREMAATIAQIGQYEAFMSRYRDRVAKGGLSAIN
ncbi:MAG TPA: hypothetical protein VF194_01530 [Ferrovibrio sp.]|uniref:tetratricopeptide repeat protein n=1 Tax=Ferrovibrio sp. TaxID=1917215 RepID=UPI002ED32441